MLASESGFPNQVAIEIRHRAGLASPTRLTPQKKRPQLFGGWGQLLGPLYAAHVIPAYAQS
jgi:hypothetical protein